MSSAVLYGASLGTIVAEVIADMQSYWIPAAYE